MSVHAKKRKVPSAKNVGEPTRPKVAGNYETHPFFITKANKMKKLIERVGLPKEWDDLTNGKPINFSATKEVGNYETHPFFVKKANEAKALLKKAGVPKVPTSAKTR